MLGHTIPGSWSPTRAGHVLPQAGELAVAQGPALSSRAGDTSLVEEMRGYSSSDSVGSFLPPQMGSGFKVLQGTDCPSLCLLQGEEKMSPDLTWGTRTPERSASAMRL